MLMKIHGNEEILKGIYPARQNKVQSPTENGFGSILKETFEKTSKIPSKTQQSTFVAPPTGVQQSVLSSQDKKLALEHFGVDIISLNFTNWTFKFHFSKIVESC